MTKAEATARYVLKKSLSRAERRMQELRIRQEIMTIAEKLKLLNKVAELCYPPQSTSEK